MTTLEEPLTTLRELIANRRSELDLSFRAAAEKSAVGTGPARRLLVSHSTLARLEAGGGQGTKINDDTLQGVALALDLPLSKVREAAGAPAPHEEFRLPKKASQLTDAERKAILSMVDALLAHHKDDG